jgi:hypothetical protein
MIAQIFTAARAKSADATGVAQPGDADALASVQIEDAGADRIDPADDFVTRDDRDLRVWQFAIDDMQVCSADTAGRDPHSDLTRARMTLGEFGHFKRGPQGFQHHCLHSHSTLHTTAPNKTPAPAVMAIARAPQNATRIAPKTSGAPPA